MALFLICQSRIKYKQDTGDDKKIAESLRLDGFKVIDNPMFAK